MVQVFEGYVPPTSATGSPTLVNPDQIVLKQVTGKHERVDLIPSRLELCRTLRNPTSKERKLAKMLARIQDQYDLIIIDCAPTDSILTDAAYFASSQILVPVKPEFMAAIGLPLLARSVNAFRADNDDHTIRISGIFFNNSSSYSTGPEGRASMKEVEAVAKREGWPVFTNQLAYSASYAKAPREAQSIDRTSHARWWTKEAYRTFMTELFAKIGLGSTP